MFFTHAHRPKFGLTLRIYSDLCLSLFFCPLPFFIISSFVAHFIVFLLHGILAGQLFQERNKYNLQRVVGKQRNWRCFPPKSYLFVSLTLLGLVRISKRRYRWKVLSLVTLLLTNLLTYTESLMGPGRKICIVPRGKKTTKAVVEGLKGLEISCSGFNCRKRSLCPIHNN